VLAVDGTRVLVSRDDGKNWKARPLFAEPDKYDCRGERAVLPTREGTLVVAFMNQREQVFRWDQKKGGPQPGCGLPVYATRSTDGGKTWEKPLLKQSSHLR
jgi:Neuraminidase (sialidase)